jgi:CBS domain-containing protein
MMTKTSRIGDWMKREVVAVRPSTSIREVAALLIDRKVGTLPVVDEAGMLIGILPITDILHIFLPDVLSLIDDIDFVKDFGAIKKPAPRDLKQAETLVVDDIMEEPVSVDEECSLLRALSMMEKHNLQDLPVVTKRGQLAGIASRVDIGRALLTNWLNATT